MVKNKTNRAKPKSIEINIPQEVQRGIYANATKVTVSDSEVILDFAFVDVAQKRGTVMSRVIITPQHAISIVDKIKQTLETHQDKKSK